jgi:hypothetical protein
MIPVSGPSNFSALAVIRGIREIRGFPFGF